MKKLSILTAGLLALLTACNKDNSTASGPIEQVTVSGLQDKYSVYTYQDFLKITPVVSNEQEHDYYWTLFSSNFTANQGLVKADTLGYTKDLNYEVKQNPGPYILVFNVKNKKTGVVRQFDRPISISTLTMNGWYLLKDHGGKTDMDFFHANGRMDNWIAKYNGKSLDGNAVKAIFVPGMKATLTAAVQYSALAVLSENDAAIYRVDNGAMVSNFDNMFFTKPATRKPQAVFQPSSTQNLGLINDGKAYNLVKGTLFGILPVNVNNILYDNISPVTAVGALVLCWNRNTKSIFCIDGASFVELKDKGTRFKNMNANLTWAAGYQGNRSIAMMLFRNPQDTGYLYKANVNYGSLTTGTEMVMIADTLKPEHNLMHANAIGGHYDVDLLYYSVGSNVYMMDVASMQETLQFTLPSGEAVTSIQHVRYPQALGTPAPAVTQNYIVIATYKEGRYKVYKHAISGLGTISAKPQADYEGEGRVTSVIYMEEGNGSRVF